MSNASDADAQHLNISLSSTYDAELQRQVYKLTFFDDGEGMDEEEFESYLRLAGRGRRERNDSDSTPSGRPIIGMLGIGSLAVAPWADRVEILTKKPHSIQVLRVVIPYAKFFSRNPNLRAGELYGESGEYTYQQETLSARGLSQDDVEKGFTIIDLVGLSEEARNELFDGEEWKAPVNPSPTDLALLVGQLC